MVVANYSDTITILPSEDENIETQNIEPQVYLESLASRVNKALDASKGYTDLVTIAEAYNDDS